MGKTKSVALCHFDRERLLGNRHERRGDLWRNLVVEPKKIPVPCERNCRRNFARNDTLQAFLYTPLNAFVQAFAVNSFTTRD